MIRGIKVGGELKDKIGIICKVMFTDLPESEMNLLIALIKYSTNNSLFITTAINKQIQIEFGLNDSLVSTALYRLSKKGVIVKSGKTISVHPAFSGVLELEKLVISFDK